MASPPPNADLHQLAILALAARYEEEAVAFWAAVAVDPDLTADPRSASSAGKNASMASSAIVTSSAVPKVVRVLKNVSIGRRRPAAQARAARTAALGGSPAARSAPSRPEVAAQLVEQREQRRVAGGDGLAVEAVQQVGAVLLEG